MRGMQGMGWEYWESALVCGESGRKCTKKMGNQCDDVGNQGGHLGIAVDMT